MMEHGQCVDSTNPRLFFGPMVISSLSSVIDVATLNESVLHAECQFHLERYCDSLFFQAGILMPGSLIHAVQKRKAEYLAGRWVARAALEEMGIKNFEIRADKSRCPVWPNSLVGSLSHTDDSAICCIAPNSDVVALGVDREKWFLHSLAEELYPTVIDIREKKLLSNSGLSFYQAITLAFSAKESLFKALFPSVGYYFDFSAARVTRISLSACEIELSLAQTLNTSFYVGCRFVLHFVLDEKCITTWLIIPR